MIFLYLAWQTEKASRKTAKPQRKPTDYSQLEKCHLLSGKCQNALWHYDLNCRTTLRMKSALDVYCWRCKPHIGPGFNGYSGSYCNGCSANAFMGGACDANVTFSSTTVSPEHVVVKVLSFPCPVPPELVATSLKSMSLT